MNWGVMGMELFGGLALFLFGMEQMASALKVVAGERMKQIKDKDGKDKSLQNLTGIPVSRWIDGVLEDKANIAQKDNVRAMVFWGNAPNSQTRGLEMKKAMEKLDTLIVVDPYPTMSAVMQDRTDGVYLLPAATQFETYGSATASNRSLQWRDKVIDPLFDSLPDHTIMYKLASKLGFADQLFKNIEVKGEEPVIEDITREFNRGMWTIGYTGQSPERLKLQAQHKGYYEGYVITWEGDTLKGLVKDRSPGTFVSLYSKIRFKPEQSIFKKKYLGYLQPFNSG